MENFSNNFLLSLPALNDSVFEESLIYICNHNKSGAMGIIINKPMPEKNIANILKETSLEQLKPKMQIYFGGPVDLSVGMFLHNRGYKTNGTINISKSISLSSNISIVDDIKNGKGPDKFKFALGYSGWTGGQLETEIEKGYWLLIPAVDDLILNTPYSEILPKIQSIADIDINTFSGGLSGLS